MKLPKNIRDKFARAGKKGGKAKVKKGLAAMPAKKRREIQLMGARKRREMGRIAREAKKAAKEMEKAKGTEPTTHEPNGTL